MPGQQQEKAFISPSGFYKESLCSSVLSSTSAITDANGSLTQHVLYFAYGETFIDEHRNSTNSPYLFNGKELDTETGRYYYGARYYDPRLSLWIGVDPLAGHFPYISPYNYVEQNPLKYIDEDGENPVGALIGGIIGGAKEIASQTISNGFTNMQNGKGFFNNWGKNMDWADVGISTASGALAGLTMGASLGANLLIESGAAIARSSIDWKGEDKEPNVIFGQGDYKKDWKEFGYDIAGEALSLGLELGTGLNSVKFLDYDSPDLSGAFWKTFTEGTLDGIWKVPTSIHKDNYITNRPINGGMLPPVEIFAPSHKKANQNNSIMRKKYSPWLQK